MAIKNRRNYYRILHVQPDAPLAVIKSSYKTIMHKLRAHPDLGGDTENAALINEAYRVLSDPVKRARYDRENKSLHKQHGNEKAQADARTKNKANSKQSKPEQKQSACPFCGALNDCNTSLALKCFRCHSILRSSEQGDQAVAYKRSVSRIRKEGKILVFLPDHNKPIGAIINDMSPRGMRFAMDIRLQEQNVIKIESEIISAVAKVATCDLFTPDSSIFSFPLKKSYKIGVSFITVDFSSKHGTFISENI